MVGKVKIPKRIGAVKVPRKIRKKANRAIKAATGPLVRDFATAAVAAAARTRANSRRAGAGEGARTETIVEIDGDRIGEAFRNAAIQGFRRFLEGFEEGLRKVQAEEKEDPRPDSQAKPRAAAKAKAPAKPKAPAKAPAKPKPPARPRPRRRATGSAAPRAPGVPSA